MVSTKIYKEPTINKKEILRYAGCGSENGSGREQIEEVMETCLKEVLPRLSYKVCYMELPVAITEDDCDFGCLKLKSKHLAKNLAGCEKAILFAATIGVDMDRLITKYSHISPAKAVLLQAIGAERIEALCDMFCEELQTASLKTRPRFSPGYGDLPLVTQKEIFTILNCSKNMGLSLNESLLISPSKSVTAFVGMEMK